MSEREDVEALDPERLRKFEVSLHSAAMQCSHCEVARALLGEHERAGVLS